MDSSESQRAAKNLAQKIFEKKFSGYDEHEIMFKSDTYKNIELMIKNVHKYRTEFTGNRKPAFLKQSLKTTRDIR